MKKEETKKTSLMLPKDLYKKAKEISKETGIKLSKLVSFGLKKEISSIEKKK